ncbi:hypothetical protein PVK06_040431 [Gossypium arboreum]|uniref:Uncharacterized protein n=1 Tax=Gossypium arboreum TaxID=29729 RepID=A0ABR0N5H0_GOSAR|nr:hypothetical protein PVK06_040431 [Gossypium arboreum]
MGNKHTWRAQYNSTMIYFTARSLVQVQDGPATPRKIIEEAYDSFMHAPLGSRGIAQLVELCSCNWVIAITGWVSNCLGSWAIRVREGQSLVLKTNILNTKESGEGKLSVVPGFLVARFLVARSSGTTRILS